MPQLKTSAQTYEQLSVKLLSETPNDPRLVRVKGAHLAIDDLVPSIRALGVLEPLVVRPVGKGYQILAGRRRFRAAKKVGQSTVPCVVRPCDDDEAQAITLTENLQRVPLHPLQEAAGIAELAEQGKTVEEISAEIGYAPKTVHRRLQLRELAPAVRKAFTEEDSPVSRWSLRHLELLASYPEAIQTEIVTEGIYGADLTTLSELKRELSYRSHELGKAPWSLDDAELVASAGACSVCPHRSGACPSLFADLEMNAAEDDHCLDGACFEQKAIAYLQRTVSEAQQAHGDALVLVSENWTVYADHYPALGQPILGRAEGWEPAKKSAKGARPAVAVDGASAGKVSWVVFPKASKRSTAATPATASDSIEEKLTRSEATLRCKRLRHAVPALLTQAEDAAVPKADVLLRLVSVFGGVGSADYRTDLNLGYQTPKSLQPKGKKKQLAGAWWVIEAAPDDNALQAITWEGVRSVLARRLDLSNAFKDVDRVEAEAAAYARLIGADWPALWEAAREACPAPKALAQRRKAVAGAR